MSTTRAPRWISSRAPYLRYLEALGEDIGGIPKNFYPGDYLIPVGEAPVKVWGDPEGRAREQRLADVRIFAVDAMMTMIRDDLAALGVKHDVFSSERALVEAGGVDAVLETLTARGLIYEGVPEPPKGKKTGDWEARANKPFSKPRNSATTWIVRSKRAMAPGLISPATWLITWTSTDAASPT